MRACAADDPVSVHIIAVGLEASGDIGRGQLGDALQARLALKQFGKENAPAAVAQIIGRDDLEIGMGAVEVPFVVEDDAQHLRVVARDLVRDVERVGRVLVFVRGNRFLAEIPRDAVDGRAQIRVDGPVGGLGKVRTDVVDGVLVRQPLIGDREPVGRGCGRRRHCAEQGSEKEQSKQRRTNTHVS